MMRHAPRPAILAALLILIGAASAGPNFVDNNTALPGLKSDRSPPHDLVHQWTASDANTVISALADLRTVAQRGPIDAKAFGAKGDGVTDDAASINAALTSAGATTNGAFGAVVYLPKGTYLAGSQVVIPNGTGLRGDGPGTVIKAAGGMSGTSLIANQHQDGTQEYAFLESLFVEGNKGAGATFSDALVSLGGLFIDSYVRDVVIADASGVGLRVWTPNAMGPVLVDNVWVLHSGGHNILVEETNANTQACAGIVLTNVTSEHQGNNSSAIYLKGLGHAGQYALRNIHIEQGGSETGRTGITLDGVSHVIVDGVQLQAGTPSNVVAGISITNVVQNVGIQIRGVTNINLINPVLNDAKNGVSIGAANLPWYVTPDVAAPPGLNFTPIGSGNSAVFNNASGTAKAWFDANGQFNGASFNGAGLDVIGDATNDRPLTLENHAKSRVFGWYFPDSSNFRLRYFSGGTDLLNFGNSGSVFLYGPTTAQSNLTLQSSLIGPGTSGAAPSSGTHSRGEVVFNADPSASGFVGWVCVTGGTPGTWKSFGAISP